ncbi:MAG: hypothetical protein K2O14_11190 [Oscillospiraceae bacterium]|nr:hypothetical protein [Oscillospiraceae bacterium]
MKLHFFKIFPKGNKKDISDKRARFEQRCSELTERLSDIRDRFDMAEDNDAIDALIYEENAVLCHLAQIYRQAKEEGLSLEHFERERRNL